MLQIINDYFGILLLGIGEISFAKIVLNKKVKVNKGIFFIVFLLVRLILTISYIYFVGTIKTFVMYIIHCLEFKFMFKLEYNKAIFLTFLYVVILLVPDMILVGAANFVDMSKVIYFNSYAGSVFFNLITSILIIVITFLFKGILRKIINTDVSNNFKIVVISLITLWCVISFLYIFASKVKLDGNSLPYLIFIVVLMFILFSLIRQTIKNNRLMEEYDKLLEFMTTYENEIEKQRILRHEAKNEFLAIKAKLCDKQKNKEIIDYIDEILKEKIIVNQEKYAKFGYLPPNGIKGLCYFKVQEAEKRGINVSINISKRIEKSSIYKLSIKDQRDLGKILGVFLDNAIEASGSSSRKQMGMEFYANKDREFVMILSNTFDNSINKGKIGKEKFTTKGKDRGHGLLLVNHIVSKNKIFEISTKISNGIYVQTLKIKKDY